MMPSRQVLLEDVRNSSARSPLGNFLSAHQDITRGLAAPATSIGLRKPLLVCLAQLQEVRAALELITDERYAFNKSLASIAREAMGTSVPTQTKSG